MSYPEQINLPFNFSSIRDDFRLLAPSPEKVSEPGFWAIIQDNSLVVTHCGESYELPEGELPPALALQPAPVCIGSWRGRPLRACSIPSDTVLEPPYLAEALNTGINRLDIQAMTLGGLARQIIHWELYSRFCSRCGGSTERIYGSWGKLCIDCKSKHYPHIHPCAIVLLKRGSEILLIRKREWVPGRYGLVAGFLDFGESLEECAVREIREETGIIAENIRYIASQNWPFPSQLMAGFAADYAGGEIAVDREELEDARWFSVDALPHLPPLQSIARWIIDNFAR
jgi:NAD+ diphosphatase